MIYLLKSPSWKPGYVRYKVGYASDVQRRIQQYEPETYLVGTRPGEVMDEQILHRRLRLLPGVRLLRNEWYIVKNEDPSLQRAFHEPKRRIEEEVWKTLKYQSDIGKDIYLYLDGLGFQSNRIFRSKSDIIDSILEKYANLSNSNSFDNRTKWIFKKLSLERSIHSRLKFLCEKDMDDNTRNSVLRNMPDTDKVKHFYMKLGPDRCKANCYSVTRMTSEICDNSFSILEISKEIYKHFKVGDKVLLLEAKDIIRSIYLGLGYNKTPKAVDLKEYFEIKKCHLTDKLTGKRSHGYKLLKKLL